MINLIGKKVGSSYIYNKKNIFVPVTIINIFNCYLFYCFKKNNNYFLLISYFLKNYFKEINYFKQCKVNEYDYFNFILQGKIPLNSFYINQNVNVFGISIGKGFSGVIKKHNFRGGDSTHGNTKAHRKLGSIGMCQDPGRVYPGKKMPGRLGNNKVFIKNLSVLKIDFNYNIFYLKGSIPGYKNSNILISPKL